MTDLHLPISMLNNTNIKKVFELTNLKGKKNGAKLLRYNKWLHFFFYNCPIFRIFPGFPIKF